MRGICCKANELRRQVHAAEILKIVLLPNERIDPTILALQCQSDLSLAVRALFGRPESPGDCVNLSLRLSGRGNTHAVQVLTVLSWPDLASSGHHKLPGSHSWHSRSRIHSLRTTNRGIRNGGDRDRNDERDRCDLNPIAAPFGLASAAGLIADTAKKTRPIVVSFRIVS